MSKRFGALICAVSLCVVAVMFVCFVPGKSNAANEPTVSYDFTNTTVQQTWNIPGQKFYYAEPSGTPTLTVTNLNESITLSTDETFLKLPNNCHVVLVGTNVISRSALNKYSFTGILSSGNVYFEGSGSLTIQANQTTFESSLVSEGIVANSVYFNGPTVNIKLVNTIASGRVACVECSGGFTMNSGVLDLYIGKPSAGTVQSKASGIVVASESKGNVVGNVEFIGGKCSIDVQGEYATGIYAVDSKLVLNSSVVDINASDYAIMCADATCVSGSAGRIDMAVSLAIGSAFQVINGSTTKPSIYLDNHPLGPTDIKWASYENALGKTVWYPYSESVGSGTLKYSPRASFVATDPTPPGPEPEPTPTPSEDTTTGTDSAVTELAETGDSNIAGFILRLF